MKAIFTPDIYSLEALIFVFLLLFSSAKSEYAELYLPRLQFGERRQFADVIETVCPLKNYIEDLIWSLVVGFIPISIVDGPFNLPYPVKGKFNVERIFAKLNTFSLNFALLQCCFWTFKP